MRLCRQVTHLLLWHPKMRVTMANMQAMMASLTFFCFGKHLPPNSARNGGTDWDSYFLIHTGC